LSIVMLTGVGIIDAQLAETPDIQWSKTYGGSNREGANSVVHTRDNSLLIAGYSRSSDGIVTGHHGTSEYPDFWVVKTDALGTVTWEKSFGGTSYDEANAACETTDGNYIIAGSSRSNDGNVTGHHGSADFSDFWIIKLNSEGNLVWQRSLGGSDEDVANAVAATNDGGCVVAGSSNSNDGDVSIHHGDAAFADYWVVKLDAEGNIQWQRSLGGTGDDNASSVIQTSDGGYVVAGTSSSTDGDVTGNHGGDDCWIVKLDSTGTILWQKSLGGSANDGASSIVQTRDGGIAIAAYSFSDDGDITGHHLSTGNSDYWIVKLNATGELQWEYTYGGSKNDEAHAILQTQDGGYAVTGTTESNDGDVVHSHGLSMVNFWTIKLDAEGILQWQSVEGRGNVNDARAIVQLNDGSFVIAGSANPFGALPPEQSNNFDFWIMKLGAAPTNISSATTDESINGSVYPNPFSTSAIMTVPQSFNGDNTPVHIVIYDMLGKVVRQMVGTPGSSVNITRDNLIPGTYFYKIFKGRDVAVSGKMVIEN